MIDILSCLCCLIFSVVLHIVHCRYLSSNKLYARLFVQYALLGLGLHALIGAMINEAGLRLYWTSILLYVLLIPAYLIVYVSTILMSPSKKILMVLSSSPKGLSQQEIGLLLDASSLIQSRIDELVESGCVVFKDNGYYLTVSGQGLFRLIKSYQAITKRKIRG